MNWIQPTFSQEISVQPKKKQRLNNCLPLSGSYSSQPILPKSALTSNNVSWIEKHKPALKSELIVNKKKVDEVESWLQLLGGDGAKILLLTGAPGSGKMTTLKILCKEMKIQVSEWITPATQEYDPDNFSGSYCSQQRSFEEFLIRASRYSSVLSSSHSKRIVLVKDIPNVFLRDPLVFHEFLQKFSGCDGISVVFILTENSIIYELFPESIKNLLKIKTINFNPITKKSILSVLTHLSKKEKMSDTLESNVISEITETCDGDLRNAIMSLHFISTKGSATQMPERRTRSAKTKTNQGSSSMKKHLVDPSVDLFHGLGRVLYSKRNTNGQLTHDPNNIVDAFMSSTNTFINMLQENYLNIFSDINSSSCASNYLAVSDFILNDSNDSVLSRDLALSISVRGLMYTNKNPIKKFNQFNKSKNSKAVDLCKTYRDCVKSNFLLSNPRTILLDSVTYLNKLGNNLENESQKNVIKELSCFYLMDKNF